MGLDAQLDNVVNLQEDEKLKLQLEIRKMSSDLKKEVTASTKKKQTIENLDSHFNSLLKKGSVLKSELDTVKKDVVNQYTEAKISNPSGQDTVEQNNTEVKTVEDDTNRIIEKTNKHGIQETKADAQGAIETIEKEIDASMATIDIKAEAKYDQWFPQVPMTKEQQDIAFSGYAWDVVDEVNKQLLTVEERARITYRFELRNLKAAVLSQTGGYPGTRENGTNEGVNRQSNGTNTPAEQGDYNRLKERSQNIEIPDNTPLFVDFYKNINYFQNDNLSPKKVFDVYKDKEIKKALDTILDPNDRLRDGTFGINPSKTDGLAGVIDTLSGLSVNGYRFSIDNDTKLLTLIGTPEGNFDGPITGKQLKAMKLNYVPHKGQKGIQLDNEWNKIAKILNTVSWDKLEGFSSVVNARTQAFSSINEHANTILTQDRLTSENVFHFLCDRNGDGILSADTSHKTEQKNQGDIGNIFGQQLFFTIEQAIGVQEALHPGQGEKIVIQKIMSNIDVIENRTSAGLVDEFNNYLSNPNSCTRDNLVSTIQKYPEFKTLFGAAIERMNGGNKVLTPDLYDTLTGNGLRDFIDSKDWEFINRIEKQIDDALKEKKAKNPEFAQKIADYNIIELRQNLITQIMNVADGLTIVGSDTQEGSLRNSGADIEISNKEAKNAFINDLTKETLNAIALGAFLPENGIRIPVTFIKRGKSESGRTLWRVQAGPSIGWNRENNDILFTLGVGGEIAEQYNYNKVINAPLDKVALAAKYIGMEGQIMAGAELKALNLGIEGSAGISWEKNPIIGINQMNRQYEDISKRIFRLTANDIDSYDSIYQALKSNINKLSQSGKYEKFATTNKKMLESNIDFVVSFLKANDVLNAIPGNKLSALEELMNIVQNGNMEQWRSDVLNNLHNKTMISRLSFGVTTNILTMSFKSNDNSHTTPGSSNTGTSSGTDIDSFSNPGKSYKFGIAGYYVGAKIANFKTRYQINENQLANARYEVAEGINTYNTSKENFKLDTQYAKYLEAVFDKEGLSISSEDGKLVIRNTNTIKLPKLLSIRVTPEAKKQVRYEEGTDTLTIGNVNEIGAYTTALANGVVRQLVIGSKKYKDGTETVAGTEEQVVDTIAMKDGIEYQPVTSNDITKLANGITETTQRTVFLNCFGPDGQLKNQKDIPNNVSVLNTGNEVDNNRITAGTIINFTRTKEGTYTLSLTQSEGSLVKLSFADIETSDFKTTKYEVYSPHPEIKNLIDTIDLDIVANLEKGKNRKYFKTFMETCDSNVREASGSLRLMIQKTPDAKLKQIRDTLQTVRVITNPKSGEKPDTEAYRTAKEQERYIVDQFKGLFAYETAYKGKPIKDIFTPRKEVFANLLIGKTDSQDHSNEYPAWVKSIVDIRKQLINIDKKYNPKDREVVHELFGYTAFYRRNTNESARDFKLVSTADTTVLPICGDPEPRYRKLNNEEGGKEAKERIIEQINQIPEQKSGLTYTILANIKNETDRAQFKAELTPDRIPELLKTGRFSLDNGTKTIILKMIPAFYFKGECVNESLGLIMDSLEVEKASSSETTIQKEQIPDRTINNKQQSVAANPDIDQNQIGATGNVSAQNIRKFIRKGDGSYTTPGSSNNGTPEGSDVNGTPNNNR